MKPLKPLFILSVVLLFGLLLSACQPLTVQVQSDPVAPAQEEMAQPTEAEDQAEDPIEDKIQNAMSAGPAVIAEAATILDWPEGWPGDWPDVPGGEFIELRPGTNGWSCLPDRPGTPTDDPMCMNEAMLAFRQAIHDETPPPTDVGVGIGYMLQGGSGASTSDPFLLEPPDGQDWAQGGPHLMISVPGGEADLAAFTTAPGLAPWVMFSDAPDYAHLMIGFPPIPETVPAEEDKIQNAMSAGPAVIAAEARILDWPEGWPGDWPDVPGGEFVELRPGTNGWNCLPDRPGTPTNDPMCLNDAMLVMRQAIHDETDPPADTGVGIGYMLQGGSGASTSDPFLLEPPEGQDWAQGGPHVMIFVPGGEDVLEAFPTAPGLAPWIMFSDTPPYAHLMIDLP